MQTPIAAYLHHIPELSIPMIPIIMTHSMIAKDTGVVSQALACADAQPHRSKVSDCCTHRGFACLCCAVLCRAVLCCATLSYVHCSRRRYIVRRLKICFKVADMILNPAGPQSLMKRRRSACRSGGSGTSGELAMTQMTRVLAPPPAPPAAKQKKTNLLKRNSLLIAIWVKPYCMLSNLPSCTESMPI